MSRTLPLPRSVLCPACYRPIPYPRIRPGFDDASEVVVGTCVPCSAFWVDLTRTTDLEAPFNLARTEAVA